MSYSAKDRDNGRVGYPRDGGQLGEPEVRDPAERSGPGLHILVPEQQAGAGLRQGRQGDQQRTIGRQHNGGHVDHQQRCAARLGQLHVSAIQLGLGQRVPARLERYATAYYIIDNTDNKIYYNNMMAMMQLSYSIDYYLFYRHSQLQFIQMLFIIAGAHLSAQNCKN